MKPASAPKPLPSVLNAKPASDDELSERIFRTMVRTGSMIRQIMSPFFESQGISGAQWVVLHILFDREQETLEPIRLVDLSNRLAIRQPSLTTVINKLVAAGLIERVAVSGDRRGKQVGLTAKGRATIKQISAIHLEKIHRLHQAWNHEEKRQFLGLLEKFRKHLEQINHSAEGDEMQRNHSGKGTA